MIKKRACLICIPLILLAGSATIRGEPAGGQKALADTPEGSVPPALLGSWHTVSLHGDCLFLILREIIVDMNKDHRFRATVVFRDHSKKSMNGTYEVEGDTIVFHSANHKEHGKAHYSFRKRKSLLLVHDKEFGVKIELKRMEQASRPSNT